MKSTISVVLLSLSLGMSAAASAKGKTVEIEVTNLTNGTYFTPLLVAAHSQGYRSFEVGTAASDALQAMAEGGSLTDLIQEVVADKGNYVTIEDPAGGPIAPGVTVAATLEIGRHARHLSVVAMLLPTNDGFVGLNGVPIPRGRGVYTYYVNGYDAGTEANDERITGGGAPGAPGIPADPGGNVGSGAAAVFGPDHNPNVHVHRGVLGDLEGAAGPSDLNADVHRWLSPVARVKVTVGGKRHD